MLGKWMREYQKIRPELKISYEPIGSGHGIARVIAGTVDFGASDTPITDSQLKTATKRILQIPVVLGAVVPAYSLPGLPEDLRFPQKVLADIYLGRITRWNDPALVRANPGVQLPDRPISVLFRIDSSGTTFVWADFLCKVSPDWKRRVGVGVTVSFPTGSGVFFNEGVVQEIKSRPYSLGYLQSTYAIENHLQFGSVENANGKFVRTSCATITGAASAVLPELPPDFRVSITNTKAEDAYPISSFTWLVIPERIDDPRKRQALAEFLTWVLTKGQNLAASKYYAPLPDEVARRALKAVSSIQ
jgi:phosphate transport system substrate-binding protein